jgi:hypothetical protein
VPSLLGYFENIERARLPRLLLLLLLVTLLLARQRGGSADDIALSCRARGQVRRNVCFFTALGTNHIFISTLFEVLL